MTQPAQQNAIQLLNVKFIKVNFETQDFFNRKLPEDLEVNLKFTPKFKDDEPNHYLIEFKVDMLSEKHSFSIHSTAIAFFKSEQEITAQFMESPFVQQNSPAIAFPFIRSFLNTLSTNIGLEPIILPAFNFSAKKKVSN
ncbi:MAG: hypothetical protein ACQESN_10955 [Thermotogota bacterium]